MLALKRFCVLKLMSDFTISDFGNFCHKVIVTISVFYSNTLSSSIMLQQLDPQPLLQQGSIHPTAAAAAPRHHHRHHNPNSRLGGGDAAEQPKLGGAACVLSDPSHPAHRVGFSEVNPHHTVHAATSSASSCSTSSNSSSNYLTIGR